MTADPQTRFWSKVRKDSSGCWIWTAANNGPGNRYGRFSFDGRLARAHRLSYEWTVGPIPDGLVLDHLCRVTLCVNPAHLEPVTPAENTRRAAALKTSCPQGHAYSTENTYRLAGKRYCRACHAESERRRRLERAA